uniref:Uncharacterized protein n=1 Tax=Trichogramma kaykai TaxID=54128 RepID=A0ABD2X2X8_9HYME
MCLVAVHRKLQKGEEGKLDGLELCEASLPGEKSSKRLFVCDQTNSLLYLVDTGAEVSALLKASSDTKQGQEHDCNFFTAELCSFMKAIKPIPVILHDKTKPFVHKSLQFCSHVFVQAKPIKKALDPPYLGPYKGTDLCDNFDNEVEIKHTQVSRTQRSEHSSHANSNKKETQPSRTKIGESNAQSSSSNKKSLKIKQVNQAPKSKAKKTVRFNSDHSYSTVQNKKGT